MGKGLAVLYKFPGVGLRDYPAEGAGARIATEHATVGVYQVSGKERTNLKSQEVGSVDHLRAHHGGPAAPPAGTFAIRLKFSPHPA